MHEASYRRRVMAHCRHTLCCWTWCCACSESHAARARILDMGRGGARASRANAAADMGPEPPSKLYAAGTGKPTPRICHEAISPVWPVCVLRLRLTENIGVPSLSQTGGSRPSSLAPHRHGGSTT